MFIEYQKRPILFAKKLHDITLHVDYLGYEQKPHGQMSQGETSHGQKPHGQMPH